MIVQVDPTQFDRLLVERGLTVTAFCKGTGISKSTAAKIRAGKPVALGVITKAARYLHAVPVQAEIGAMLASSEG